MASGGDEGMMVRAEGLRVGDVLVGFRAERVRVVSVDAFTARRVRVGYRYSDGVVGYVNLLVGELVDVERVERVAAVRGAVVGDELFAVFDEDSVTFSVRNGGRVCDSGSYSWEDLAGWFWFGETDGAWMPSVVVDHAGEWVRNRLVDFAVAAR